MPETRKNLQQLLAAIVTSADDAILAKNLEGIILFWNKGAERIYGHTAEEAVGQSVSLILPEDRKHELTSILSRLAQGERIEHYETVRLTKAGRRVDVSVTISPIVDARGRVIAASAIAREITAEKMLRQERNSLAAIVESSDDAIFSKTLNGVITSWNTGAAKLYGYSQDEVIGKSVSILMPDDRGDEISSILQRITKGEKIQHFETVRRRKDGTLVNISLTVSPIRDEDGAVIAASAIARDITERRKVDELVQQQLQEKNVLLQEIHHRVKNNLQVISSLLSMQLVALKDPAARAPLIESQSRIRSMALIHEKLYNSATLAEINFSTYLTDLCKMLASTYSAEARRVTIEIDCDPVLLDVSKAVPYGLLVHEILSNSFRHAFPDNRKGVVKVAGHSDDNDGFVLEVSDNGIGLPTKLNTEEQTTLGMKLIRILADQIQAQLQIDAQNGTRYSIRVANMRD